MKIFVGAKFQSGRIEPNVTRLPFVSGRCWAQNARKVLRVTIYRPAAYPFYFRATRRDIYIERKNYILRDFPGSADVRETRNDLDV